MSIDKLALLRAQHTKVNETYGEEIVRKGIIVDIPRIPTGSLSQDVICGCNSAGYGGWAVGHMNCVVGWESSGKTTACLKAIGNLQKMCVRCYREAVNVGVTRLLDDEGAPVLSVIGKKLGPEGEPIDNLVPYYTVVGKCSCFKEGLWTPDFPEFTGNVKQKKEQKAEWALEQESLLANSFEAATIVYADCENTLDLKWGKRHGVHAYVWDEEYQSHCPVAQFQQVVPGYAEQCIDLVDEYIIGGAVDMIVVDSIPAMVPKIERDASAEDLQRGIQAQLINKAVRRWVGSVADMRARTVGRRLVTMMIVQQWRHSMSAFAGNTMPGGNGQRFAYSIINEYYTNDKEERKDGTMNAGKDSEAIKTTYTLRVNVKNRKNKTSPPFRTSSFRMALVDDEDIKAGAVLDLDYIFKTAMALGMVEKVGSKYKFLGKDYTAQSHIVSLLSIKPSIKRRTVKKIRQIVYSNTEGQT